MSEALHAAPLPLPYGGTDRHRDTDEAPLTTTPSAPAEEEAPKEEEPSGDELIVRDMDQGMGIWHTYVGITPSWRVMLENRVLWQPLVEGFEEHLAYCPFHPRNYTANFMKLDYMLPENKKGWRVYSNGNDVLCACPFVMNANQEKIYKSVVHDCLSPSPADMFKIVCEAPKMGMTSVLVHIVAKTMCDYESRLSQNVGGGHGPLLVTEIDVFVGDEDRQLRFMDLLCDSLESQGRTVTTSLSRMSILSRVKHNHIMIGCRIHTHRDLNRVQIEPGSYVFVDDAFDLRRETPNLYRFLVSYAYRPNTRTTDPTNAGDQRRMIVAGTQEDLALRGKIWTNWIKLRDLSVTTKSVQDSDLKQHAIEDHKAKMEEAEALIKEVKAQRHAVPETKEEQERVTKAALIADDKSRKRRLKGHKPRPLTNDELRQVKRADARSALATKQDKELASITTNSKASGGDDVALLAKRMHKMPIAD